MKNPGAPVLLMLPLIAISYSGATITTLAFSQTIGAAAASRTPPRTTNLRSSTLNDDDLPFSYSPDVPIAIEAVRKACRITTKLQNESIETLTKKDLSPVTVADFASQAAVLQHLVQLLPDDTNKVFLAEERSDNLTPIVTQQILQALREETDIYEEELLRDCIDLGQSFYSKSNKDDEPPDAFWCLDPIDGTKGFLRKGQYCVALGLIKDGIPTIGILGCPNLPFDDDETGCIFVACKGQGCFQLDMKGAKKPKRIGMGYNPLTTLPVNKARFCVGVEQGFGDPTGKAKEMARLLHGDLTSDGEIVHAIRMDSQAKYGVVARGDAEFYVRLPRLDYQEWIWDVAPGVLVLTEAGGKVTDANGNYIDFSCGAKLSANYGVLGASSSSLHQDLRDAFCNNN